MISHRTPLPLVLLAFALTACGQEQAKPVHQNQTAKAVPAAVEPQPPVNPNRRKDGPVFNGKTY